MPFRLLIKALAGEFGFARTFWFGCVAFGLILAAAVKFLRLAALDGAPAWAADDSLRMAVVAFVNFYSIFISLAVINAAAHERDRGVIGWLVSLVAGLNILRTFYVVGAMAGLVATN